MNSRAPEAANVVPTRPSEIQRLFSTAPFQWWISGCWALDLFTGEQTRPHFDVDVGIARSDQLAVQRHLSNWDFQYAVRTGDEVRLQRWKPGQMLGFEVHGIWVRQTPDSPWSFEFWLHEIQDEVWTFRYGDKVRHPLQHITGQTPEGIPYLKPEIALLYKAARMREVDIQDFERVLGRLSVEQRSQLAADIALCWPQHPWLGVLI